MSKLTLEETTLVEKAWAEWLKYRFGREVEVEQNKSSNN